MEGAAKVMGTRVVQTQRLPARKVEPAKRSGRKEADGDADILGAKNGEAGKKSRNGFGGGSVDPKRGRDLRRAR